MATGETTPVATGLLVELAGANRIGGHSLAGLAHDTERGTSRRISAEAGQLIEPSCLVLISFDGVTHSMHIGEDPAGQTITSFAGSLELSQRPRSVDRVPASQQTDRVIPTTFLQPQ